VFKFYTETPFWFILFCFILALGYSFLLYYKAKELNEFPSWLKKTMFALRMICVFLIAFLLLSPFIKIVGHTLEKPILILAHDNSASLKNNTSVSDPTYLKNLQSLEQELSKDFEVHTYTFGEKISDGSKLDFIESSTDFSMLFNSLESKFLNRNVGALILASDGIYNSGSNPIYDADQFNAPVFSIALGDTTVRKDLIVSGVRHNKTVVIGNTFPIEVSLNARQCSGEKAIIRLYKESTLLSTRELNISGSRYSILIPFYIEAIQKGLHQYTITADKLGNETTYQNNSQTFFIEVIENKNKVLILAAAPHPDLGAIKVSLENNFNYDADITLANNFNLDFNNYSCAILHQIPSASSPGENILNKINQLKIPHIFIIGAQSDPGLFNKYKTGVEIRNSNGKNNDVLASINNQFSLFTTEDETKSRISNFPPLIQPFGTYVNTSNNQVFAVQKIGGVKTDQPLIVFNNADDVRRIIIAGEGLWRWKLKEYSEFSNHQAVDEFILKCVQYVSTTEKRSPFKVNHKSTYRENESVLFDAELYNESGELVNSSDVSISIVQQNTNASFPFTFSKTQTAYQLNAGNLNPGIYTYYAQTKLADQLYKQSGRFTVSEVQLEFSETVANHQLLYTMSEKSGGEMIYPNELIGLLDKIKSRNDIKPVSYEQSKTQSFIDLKSVFALIILLLFIEWAIRKYNGAY